MTEEDTNRADPPQMEVDPQAEALARLREMGFGDENLNRDILAGVGNDSERAVRLLVGDEPPVTTGGEA